MEQKEVNGGTKCPILQEVRKCNTQGCTLGTCFAASEITGGCQEALESALIPRARGTTTTIAGVGTGYANGPGHSDGGQHWGKAKFNEPCGIAVEYGADRAGNKVLLSAIVADSRNFRLRMWDAAKNQVTTIAGDGHRGVADGNGMSARIGMACGLARQSYMDPKTKKWQSSNVYFADDYTLRSWNPMTGDVKTIVGKANSKGRCKTGKTTRLTTSQAVAVHGYYEELSKAQKEEKSNKMGKRVSVVYWIDAEGALLRYEDKKDAGVNVIAGQCGIGGYADGRVADKTARLGSQAQGIAVHGYEDDEHISRIVAIYFTEKNLNVLRRVQWGPNNPKLSPPAIKASEMVNAHNTAKAVVVTIVGARGARGYLDGLISSVRFSSPTNVFTEAYASPSGSQEAQVWITDDGNQAMRVYHTETQRVSTAFEFSFGRGFHKVGHAGFAVSHHASKLFKMDLTLELPCKNVLKLMKGSFDNWDTGKAGVAAKEAVLTLTEQGQRKAPWILRFAKKEVIAKGESKQPVGKLTKHVVCYKRRDSKMEEQCCVHKEAQRVSKEPWGTDRKSVV